MSKKTLYIILGSIIIIALLVGVYFLTRDTIPTIEREIPTSDGSQPFGSEINPSDTSGRDDPFEPITDDGPLPLLRQITNEPVAGATTITTAAGDTVRYIERATGHVFDGNLSDILVKRISNTTIAGIHDAIWTTDGTRVVARFLSDDTIQTFTGALIDADIDLASEEFTTTSGNEKELQGSFLPNNITSITSSLDGSKIFYILSSASGAFGVIANPNGSSKKTIFTSPLSEWQVNWDTDNFITLTSNPTNGVSGIAYTLDTRNSKLTRILTDIRGVTSSMSTDGKRILYSESNRSNELSLKVRLRSDGSILSTGLQTLPEKCVWSELQSEIVYCAAPSILDPGTYPDSWYLGLVSFDDVIWRIDTTNGSTDIISDLERQAGEKIDATNLFFNESESHIFFLNKKDSSLWSLELVS
ncbi:hypothetical protein COB55_05045 [Candidatus Wolfebacteria bacterium]|nr:MAG: hypothetical protein COB55_05045 [Candidatus Wolfebacteria bacterium]